MELPSSQVRLSQLLRFSEALKERVEMHRICQNEKEQWGILYVDYFTYQTKSSRPCLGSNFSPLCVCLTGVSLVRAKFFLCLCPGQELGSPAGQTLALACRCFQLIGFACTSQGVSVLLGDTSYCQRIPLDIIEVAGYFHLFSILSQSRRLMFRERALEAQLCQMSRPALCLLICSPLQRWQDTCSGDEERLQTIL